ncbi:MAG: ribosome biogenesis GTPase YlqF [Oscillospiraceae bacterium]|nr:ribosome biogenesis GTPase YlqF [Oscillospiraceae bacterium]
MSELTQNIQWFPGHMTKTLRMMQSEIKNVDIVIELLDARIPFSSKNPAFTDYVGQKNQLLLLNKSDLADSKATEQWLNYYRVKGYEVITTVSRDKATKHKVLQVIKNMQDAAFRTRISKGMTGLKTRAMVIGIPNVGKSTFINQLSDSASTRVEDRPGVTRGKQWIITPDIELLDMPGVLWPKFESNRVAYNLAFTGAISDKVIDITDLALTLLEEIKTPHYDALSSRYKLEYDDGISAYELLKEIARKRGMLISKGEIDILRASIMLIDELRAGKLGPITFEAGDDI